MSAVLPEPVRLAAERAERAGFAMSCDRGARRAVPPAAPGDALEVTRRADRFDLIFADAQGGKWEGLDATVAALRPGGQLLVDDMTPGEFADEHHARKAAEVRSRLLGHPDLVSVEIAWSSGLILSTRRIFLTETTLSVTGA